MGHFDGEKWVTGPEPSDLLRAGSPAGVHEPERGSLGDASLKERAKLMMPSPGPRQGEPPPSSLDVGSQQDRRDLTRAAEFAASMPGDQAQQFSEYLAAELKQLDETVGPAEDGRQEHAEKMSLTLDLADETERQAAEGAEAQLAFYAWAMEQFGGRDEFFKWADEQDDPKEAITELAEEYLLDQEEGGEDDGEQEDEERQMPTSPSRSGSARRLATTALRSSLGSVTPSTRRPSASWPRRSTTSTPSTRRKTAGGSDFDDDGFEDDGGDSDQAPNLTG